MCAESASSEDQALCHFKFFVYREYREMRHLGGKGEYQAFAEQASKCRELSRKGERMVRGSVPGCKRRTRFTCYCPAVLGSQRAYS